MEYNKNLSYFINGKRDLKEKKGRITRLRDIDFNINFVPHKNEVSKD